MTTKIQWTDETWNPVVGCTKVSQGCKPCYAKTLHDKRHKAYLEGAQLPDQYALPFEVVQLMPERLEVPLHWRKPRRVFVNSVSDLFHEDVPDEFIDRVFAVMALTPQHTYQVLTKRPERMRERFVNWKPLRSGDVRMSLAIARLQGRDGAFPVWSWPLPNVWLGVSVEDQAAADSRIPDLLATPAAVRFVSCEPLLEELWIFNNPMDAEGTPPGLIARGVQLKPNDVNGPAEFDTIYEPGIDWVIAGGESGTGARPCDLAWIRSIVAQCRAASVPVFCKQLGSRPYDGMEPWQNPLEGIDEEPRWLRLRHSHGGDPAEWPEDLRVREFPQEDSNG